MADENNAAETADTASGSGATLTSDTPPAAHAVSRPLGEEFPLTDHESIAAKLEAKIEDVCFAIETDIKNGVHFLKGWLKIS